MRRNQGKPGHITRDEFSENWDRIFEKSNGLNKKEDKDAKKKDND